MGIRVHSQWISPQIIAFRERWLSSPEQKAELERKKKSLPTSYSQLDPSRLSPIPGTQLSRVDISGFRPEWEDVDTLLLHQPWWQFWKDPVAIRLSGIDAPEIAHPNDPTEWFRYRQEQPYGREALSIVNKLIDPNRLSIAIGNAPGQQTYGRYLGVLSTPEIQNVNVELVRRGLAAALPFGESGSDLISRRQLRNVEEEAISENRGMWQESFFRKYLEVSRGLGGRLTLNTLTDLTRLGSNYHLAAAAEYMWDDSQQSAATGRYIGRKLVPSYGRFFHKNNSQFSAKDDNYNTIEGLFHGGLAGQLRKAYTDFGSGYKGGRLSGDLTFYDLETTGLIEQMASGETRYPRIVEIGGLRVTPEGEVSHFSTLIKSKEAIVGGGREIHHIQPEMLLHAPRAREALSSFMEFAKGSTLVGWNNVKFDDAVLSRELLEHRIPSPLMSTVDLLPPVREITENKWQSYALSDVGNFHDFLLQKQEFSNTGLLFNAEELRGVRAASHRVERDIQDLYNVYKRIKWAGVEEELESKLNKVSQGAVRGAREKTRFRQLSFDFGEIAKENIGGEWINTQEKVVAGRELDKKVLRTPFQKMSVRSKMVLGTALLFGGYSLFSSKDDNYNTIEGLPHGGMAGDLRKIYTDFGSGWQGIGLLGAGAGAIAGLRLFGMLSGARPEEEEGEEDEGMGLLSKIGMIAGVSAAISIGGQALPAIGLAYKITGKVNKDVVFSSLKAGTKSAWEAAKARFSIIKKIYTNKDIAETFAAAGKEAFPEGLFSTGAGRALAPVQLLAKGVHHTAAWLKKNWVPELKRMEPGALGLAALSVYDAYHIGTSAYEGDWGDVAFGLGTFAAAKYAYMGWYKTMRTPELRKKSFEWVKKQKLKDWIGYGASAMGSVASARDAAIEAAVYYPQFIKTGVPWKEYAKGYGESAVETYTRMGKNISEAYKNQWQNIPSFIKEKFEKDSTVKDIIASFKKVQEKGKSAYEDIIGKTEEDWVREFEEMKGSLAERQGDIEKQSWAAGTAAKKYQEKINTEKAGKIAADLAARFGRAVERGKEIKGSGSAKEGFQKLKDIKNSEATKEKIKDLAEKGKAAFQKGKMPSKEDLSNLVEELKQQGEFQDLSEQLKQIVQENLGNTKIPSKDDFYNTIEGLKHGGLAEGIRKKLTDFGSGYDAIRALARKLGKSFEEIIGSSEFRESLQKGLASGGKLGRGAFGETFVYESEYMGKKFSFVGKRTHEEGKVLEELLKSGKAEIGPHKYIANYNKIGLQREEEVMRMIGGRTSTVPEYYGKIDDMILMEHMPGKTLSELKKEIPGFVLPTRAAKKLERTMARAEQYGYINPDLNTGNILYDPVSKRVSSIDYGFAQDVMDYAPGKAAEAKQFISERLATMKDPSVITGFENTVSSPEMIEKTIFDSKMAVKIRQKHLSDDLQFAETQLWQAASSGGRNHLSRSAANPVVQLNSAGTSVLRKKGQ